MPACRARRAQSRARRGGALHDLTARRRSAADAELEALRRKARTCKDCPVWANATQTVFGEGPARARLMLVGEQPGDREDLEGQPFIGPAGRILDEGLAAAGIDRAAVYVTNAVKHFKWEPRGKRRMHKSPAQREIDACSQWLERELQAVAPKLVVALGATAAKALLGPRFRITQARGTLQHPEGLPPVIATYHPSFILRVKSRPEGAAVERDFVADLKRAARAMQDESDP